MCPNNLFIQVQEFPPLPPKPNSSQFPGLLADVFARVGGPDRADTAVQDSMITVDGDGVILDNVWLWRGDIGAATQYRRDVKHGAVINGENVTAYGLASEHTQSHNTVWNGEKGTLYFYQAELDSFAHQEASVAHPSDDTPNYGPDGSSGYLVNAKEHFAVGVGVYVWQVEAGVLVESGVKVLHPEVEKTIICPFKWAFNPTWWKNHESDIRLAIDTVKKPARGPVGKFFQVSQ